MQSKTLFENPKLYSLSEAVDLRKVLKKEHKSLVLTNGCFDLLHPGHISYLQLAKKEGQALWVLLNSDESVRKLKGPLRPIQSEKERAFSLAALACVDGIVIFNTPRLDKEILALEPDRYVKAGDYSIGNLDPEEKKALEAVNAQIEFLPFVEGYSTTEMIRKITQASDTF